MRDQGDEYADGGRGLYLMDLLASRWGFTRDRHGTTTRFEVATSGGGTARREWSPN